MHKEHTYPISLSYFSFTTL